MSRRSKRRNELAYARRMRRKARREAEAAALSPKFSFLGAAGAALKKFFTHHRKGRTNGIEI